MKTRPFILCLALLFLSSPLLADDDCDDPVAKWQPRENLRQKLEAEGWTVYRIKVDDGCYDVKGRLSGQYRAKASFAPASLTLMKLKLEREETNDENDADNSYGSQTWGVTPDTSESSAPRNGIVKGRPSVKVE
ncbi:PepSY domain-containing protein [Marinobacter halophilus]|uniref:PepSY domain-containing protein n=1 Tax=Marinobacter halophilus TaxID=1323740 RepID=A0A2T1KFH0_9GAMM|nr:PepSY domain-containing protein [Marinobacter halophilus]PSF08855.1 PepSY domain-containing protein [Marinobacter halophilus]GGC64524.1 hypothetical protein GCM10011362_10980 [Marinobacter halophilus]